MNNEQARFLLRAYRPSGRDAGDPAFADALRQAQGDPALGTWFAGEQAFDAAVAAKMRALAPPAGLREAILTGARMSRTVPRERRRPAVWMALAASVAVLLALTTYWLRHFPMGPADLDRMAAFALVEPGSAHTGPHADHLGAFGAWLQNPGNRVSAGPPADLAQLRAQGCRVVKIAGHDVFEICFQREGDWYHLYLARRDDFSPDNAAAGPIFREADRRSVVAWADRRLAYVLMSAAGAEALRRIL
jgi:hypothetical protein